MQAAKLYASKTDSSYLCIKDFSFLPKKSAAFQKLSLLEMNEYEKILYIDSDAVVQDRCPNIFEMDIEGLAAVPDFDDSIEEHKAREIKTINRLNLNNIKPFCSGVFLTDRNWRQSKKGFVYDLLNKSTLRDQDILNKAQDGSPYTQLSHDWGAWYREGKYISHYGGLKRKEEFL